MKAAQAKVRRPKRESRIVLEQSKGPWAELREGATYNLELYLQYPE